MKASIIIRAYNSESTLARAIDSALAQSFQKDEFEIIIVDDGSTDKTSAIIETYAADARVRAIHRENTGAIAAGNRGFREAKGGFVALLDSDDEFSPEYLSKVQEAFEKDPSCTFVYTDYFEEWQDSTRIISVQDLFHTAAVGTAIRREALKSEGFWSETVTVFPEYEILLRTLDRWSGAHLPEPLFTYHRRHESITSDEKRVRNGIQELLTLYPDHIEEISRIRSYTLT